MPKGQKIGESNTKGSGTVQPGYPPAIDQGSESPEGYQKEHRSHKSSSAGTKLPKPFGN